jgi:phosphohistidine phosphatase
MKRLFLIRHAKSSWENPYTDDHERPLNTRGRKDAPEMAKRLYNLNMTPDLMISSTAERAKQTALVFSDILSFNESKIVWTDELYHASPETILKVVNSINEQYNRVFMFGHNPGFTDFVNELASVKIDNIPTCGIAVIQVKGSWETLTFGQGVLHHFDYPKNR